MDLNLPVGLANLDGSRSVAATLHAINGWTELHWSHQAAGPDTLSGVLQACLTRLGPHRGAGLTVAVLDQLLPIDHAWLAAKLLRECWGPTQYLSLHCTNPGCGARLDFTLDLDAIEPPALSPADLEVALAVGGGLRFAWPGVADLAALEGLDEAAQGAELFRRCWRADPDRIFAPPPVLDADERVMLARALKAGGPRLDLTMALECAECGASWGLPFDPVGRVRDLLRDSAGRLHREIHLLAWNYGWSRREILSLSMPERKIYLALISDQLRDDPKRG